MYNEYTIIGRYEEKAEEEKKKRTKDKEMCVLVIMSALPKSIIIWSGSAEIAFSGIAFQVEFLLRWYRMQVLMMPLLLTSAG